MMELSCSVHLPIIDFLALLNRFAIHRGYVVPNFCIVRLCCMSCHRRRKHFVQTLSHLKFMDQLASNFTRMPRVKLQLFLHFFSPI